MRVLRQEWVGGLLCISLAAFCAAGCRRAQPIAKPPAAAQSAQPSTAQPASGTKSKTPAAAEPKEAVKAQPLGTDAKAAASETEQAANDLLTGIKQELGEDPYPSSGEIVNINYSSEEKILTLPGMTPELAMKVIRNRPYATPTDLIAKHVLNQAQYDRIKTRLTAWDNLWTNQN